jgi:hypothetical protein
MLNQRIVTELLLNCVTGKHMVFYYKFGKIFYITSNITYLLDLKRIITMAPYWHSLFCRVYICKPSVPEFETDVTH